MRPLSVVIAVLVCAALYFAVLERERLTGFAARLSGEEVTVEEAEVQEAPSSISDSARADSNVVQVVVRASMAREVEDAIMLRGQTEAARNVIVAAEITGTVASEPLRRGTFVQSGDVLCQLDPGTREASLAEAQARLAEAQARRPEVEARVLLARAAVAEREARVAEAEARLEEARINQAAASQLSEGGFASQTRVANAAASLRAAEATVVATRTSVDAVEADIESARAAVEAVAAAIRSAEAGVERAERDIENLTIEAPFSGHLETDTAELGALLQPGTMCAEIVQLDPIKLVGFLPEAEVNRVEFGSPVGGRLASGLEVTGRVTYVGRSADDVTRTFRVEAEVPNPDLAIRDGQTVEMLIRTAPRSAHLLPASALTLNDEGRLGLRIVEDGRAAFVPVELLRDTVDGVLIAGLPDAVDVIVVGQEYVTDGVPVEPTYDEASIVAKSRAGTEADNADEAAGATQ
jgi:multidrug efflux system membrane fusion protein